MTSTQKQKLAGIEKYLKEKIIGQDEAIEKISKAIKRSKVGLSDPTHPVGSFLFVGPTGVGKTELTKKLAGFLFDDENNLIRVDMSELGESHSISKLIGSPPGYVGYETGGALTEKVRQKPYSLLLFDEFEKAHPDVFNVLLQILDNGKVTDSKGREVDFRNTIIILTSNIGSKFSNKMNNIGFLDEPLKDKKREYKEMKQDILSELEEYFKPEFLNRLDDVIVFDSLSEKSLEKIAILELDIIKKRLKNKGIKLQFTKKVVKAFIDKKYPKEFGARPIKRMLQEKVLDIVADQIINNEHKQGSFKIIFDKKDGLKVEFKEAKGEKKIKTKVK